MCRLAALEQLRYAVHAKAHPRQLKELKRKRKKARVCRRKRKGRREN
jgi:hypothetical protein